ncbi:MAG: hypothetical protein ACOYK8_08410 [Alphaproteobacteria bacterium]
MGAFSRLKRTKILLLLASMVLLNAHNPALAQPQDSGISANSKNDGAKNDGLVVDDEVCNYLADSQSNIPNLAPPSADSSVVSTEVLPADLSPAVPVTIPDFTINAERLHGIPASRFGLKPQLAAARISYREGRVFINDRPADSSNQAELAALCHKQQQQSAPTRSKVTISGE